MSIYRPPNVHKQPEVKMMRWTVRELPEPNKTRHVVGLCEAGAGPGRVSSAVQSYDPETRVAITKSGRRYLLGKDTMGWNMDAEYVWGIWCHSNGDDADNYLDVSDEYV